MQTRQGSFTYYLLENAYLHKESEVQYCWFSRLVKETNKGLLYTWAHVECLNVEPSAQSHVL